MKAQLKCPKCGRILGDTEKTTDAWLNCRCSKEPVRVRVEFTKWADYLPERSQNG